MIQIDKLAVRFGSTTVVRDASFQVAAGECFGLVGESGSGKSTVLRAVMHMSEVVETMTHEDQVARRMTHDYSRSLVAASGTAR